MVEVFRGIHDVLSPNLTTPGCFWSVSFEVATRYVQPDLILFDYEQGFFRSGYILHGLVNPSDFDRLNVLNRFKAFLSAQAPSNDTDSRDLFEIFIPSHEKHKLFGVRVYHSFIERLEITSGVNDS